MSDSLAKLNLKSDKRKLTQTDLINMKRVEEINLQRVAKLKITRRKNIFTAAALICSVLGIYSYTIKTVQQEEFLDDFNEPEKITFE